MLRKRSRAVSTKQSLMCEPPSLPSPTGKHSRPSSLFASPRLFVGLSAKSIISDCEAAAMSPTSILEAKPFSSIANPFFSDKNPRKPHPDAASAAAQTVSAESKHRPWESADSRAIGLGIVDALDQPDKKSSRADSRMVLFGSRLKIQIPSTINATSMDSPHPTIEFGVKNKNSQLALLSPAARRSPIGFADAPPPPSSPGVFTGCLSASEMEMSEDYTCVIAHGPNPRTTHIFDNCIVESCCGGSFTPPWKESRFLTDHSSCHADDFLAFCYACKKRLGQGKDIFMYRGEKAFCSSECRYQEMMFDEGVEKASSSVSSASL